MDHGVFKGAALRVLRRGVEATVRGVRLRLRRCQRRFGGLYGWATLSSVYTGRSTDVCRGRSYLACENVRAICDKRREVVVVAKVRRVCRGVLVSGAESERGGYIGEHVRKPWGPQGLMKADVKMENFGGYRGFGASMVR